MTDGNLCSDALSCLNYYAQIDERRLVSALNQTHNFLVMPAQSVTYANKCCLLFYFRRCFYHQRRHTLEGIIAATI